MSLDATRSTIVVFRYSGGETWIVWVVNSIHGSHVLVKQPVTLDMLGCWVIFFAKCFLWWDWLINQAFFGRNMLGTFSDRWSLIFAWIPRVISMVIWKVSSKCAKTWFSWYSSDRLKSSTGIIRWFFLYLRLENMQCFCRVSILSQEILAKPQDIGAYGYKYKQYGFVYTYMYITTYIFVYIDTYMLQTRVQTFVFQTKPVWKLMLLFTWMRWRH